MANVPEITLRLLAGSFNNTGEEAANLLDETLCAAGFGARMVKRVALGPSASDESHALGTDLVGLILYSHDYEFSYRLAGGETLVGPVRAAVPFFNDDTDTEAIAGAFSILLTGNGANMADVEIWAITKSTT